jgi:hypothetical protein
MAQFGRGALADVSEKLLAQFVANLESTVLAGAATADAAPSAGAASQAEVPINLLGSSGLSLALPLLRRFAPVALVIVALIAFLLTR